MPDGLTFLIPLGFVTFSVAHMFSVLCCVLYVCLSSYCVLCMFVCLRTVYCVCLFFFVLYIVYVCLSLYCVLCMFVCLRTVYCVCLFVFVLCIVCSMCPFLIPPTFDGVIAAHHFSFQHCVFCFCFSLYCILCSQWITHTGFPLFFMGPYNYVILTFKLV